MWWLYFTVACLVVVYLGTARLFFILNTAGMVWFGLMAASVVSGAVTGFLARLCWMMLKK